MKNILYFALLLIALYFCDKKQIVNPSKYGVTSGDPRISGVLLWIHLSIKNSIKIANIK